MKYNTLESLRGLAAILVALYHSGFIVSARYPVISQGAIFVDFFFVLSGFVMAFAYSDKIENKYSFKKFIVLRFGRLYPLHIFMLFVWLPYILVKAFAFYQLNLGVDPFIKNDFWTFLSNLFLLNSMGLHSHESWNTPAWSISVEFYTYIVFYFSVAFLKSSRMMIIPLGISCIGYGVLFSQTEFTLLVTSDWGFFRCIGGFFLGVFLYQLPKLSFIQVGNKVLISVIELFLFGLMLYLVSESFGNKIYQIMCFITFALIIYVFSLQERGLVSSLLLTRPFQFLGKLSYSIYMVHAIILVGMGNVWEYVIQGEMAGTANSKLFITPYAHLINLAALSFIVFVSYLTYTYIEMPYRDKFRKLAAKF